MRVHVQVDVSASPFRVPIEPGSSTRPIYVENMFFLQNVYMHRFHAFMGPYAFNVGPHNVNVSPSPFHVPIEPRCSIGPIDVENMVFTKCVPAPFSCIYGPVYI